MKLAVKVIEDIWSKITECTGLIKGDFMEGISSYKLEGKFMEGY